MIAVVLVALGAAIGAPARYLTDRAQARDDSLFPWGTFTVNAVGCFLLGLLATTALHTPGPVAALLGTGLCGALTTYSTFGYETLRLIQDGTRFYALVNVVASLIAGLGAAYVGTAVAQALL